MEHVVTQRYTVETVNDAWSYINGPDGYREGPYRYRWEAEEYAAQLERGCAPAYHKRLTWEIHDMHETRIEKMYREAQFVTGLIRAVNARGRVPDVEAALQYRRAGNALTWAVDDYCKRAPSNVGFD